MRCTTLTALLLGVMLYLVMGALVFLTLETPKETSEEQKYQGLNGHCEHILTKLSCVQGVFSAVEAGLDVSSLSANLTTRWDMASAIFFCGTIITTIGFGNLSPHTTYGQLFCVCYALVGIPMFGILLAGVGDHMGTVLRRAVAKIETLFLKRKVRPTTVRVISAVLSILIGCLIFLAVPTVVFQEVEEWTFLESLYFVVITLTTVGFGDFVPDGKIFKPLVLLWIVFGLAYFASILTMIGNWLRVLSKRTRAEMEELRAHATDWTQNMDFRIPNPLEFNDPFLLQRRRWKRSERRRIRRGAQCTLGYLVRGGSENGHLPNHWAGLSNSLSQLDAQSSLENAGATKPKPQGGAAPRAAPGLRADVPEGLQGPEGSSASSSFSGPHKFPAGSAEEGGAAFMNTTQETDKNVPTQNCDSVENHKHSSALSFPPYSAPHLPSILSLLDFFGENLAYIDESSDTLSERGQVSEERRRRPRKPKRRSMRRQLSRTWSPLQVRRPSMQPPSNPPTPPPDSPRSEQRTHSAL
uniref:Potassium channel, subfamily K, member 4a n=1 Tax=Salarias fasciatus TaxID=181472 RepID=A0A672GG19_SALFA